MNCFDSNAISIPFLDHAEHDFFINRLAYNNFDYIKPIHQFRTQSFYTLHIILEGSGTLIVNENRYQPKAGAMFFIPPGSRLCYYPDTDTPWKYVWFELHGKNVPLYAEKMGFDSRNHLVKCKDFANIKFLLQRLFQHYLQHGLAGYYDTLSVFYKILDTNLKNHRSVDTNIIHAVISYIHCHYHNPSFSVPELCRYFSISHSYLCNLFKKANGCSIKNYIIQVRILNSCKLLESTTHSIKEIAFSVGFSDENHFMKTFRNRIGKTPTQYRQETS